MCSRHEENGIPVCSPIQTLNDLLHWEPGQDSLCISREPLQPRAPHPPRPLTLVCHDMMMGYLEDRFVQSVNKENGYRFFNWQYVDIFVYFSHHFITIPPCGWIISAHRNRVPILGTLITENEKGKNICKQFLSSPSKFMAVADKMIEIAEYYNMDGWLLNIENIVHKTQIQHLCDFVSYLKSKMGQRIPNSKVIWYDSVINNGSLCWQNELNEKNMIFFEKSDGLFLNYNWSKENLSKSKQLCTEKSRPYDVFVGVDVFGRGCYGGGGYNTNKALEVIRTEELSAAIFANGWVYECHESKNYLENETKFWSLLHGFCPSHCPIALPLVTSFCHGYGQNYFLNGECISTQEWVSLGLQQLQPVKCKETNAVVSHMMYLDDAFLGGGCLLVEKQTLKKNKNMSSIFSCCIPVTEPLLISYTTKHLFIDCSIQLELTLQKENNVTILMFSDVGHSSTDYQISELKKEKLLDIFGENVDFLPSNGHNGWQQHYFLLDENWISAKITDISIGIGNKSDCKFSFLFGQLQILPIENLWSSKKPDVLNMSMKKHESTNIMVEWTSDHSSISHFNVYITNRYRRCLIVNFLPPDMARKGSCPRRGVVAIGVK